MDNQVKRKVGRPKNTEEQSKIAKKKQQEYIYKWERDNYDRVVIRFPAGTKARIQAIGESVNGFAVRAVLDKLDTIEASKHNVSVD